MRTEAGFVICAVGLAALLFPVLSVWSFSRQAFDQLPAGVSEVSDRHHRFAMSDPEFVVGERIYLQRKQQSVEVALRAAGFEPVDSVWMSKDCCGDYEAVLANVHPYRNGDVRVVLTAANTDIQAWWPNFVGPGAVATAIGFGLIATDRSVRRRMSRWALGPRIPYTDYTDELELERLRAEEGRR